VLLFLIEWDNACIELSFSCEPILFHEASNVNNVLFYDNDFAIWEKVFEVQLISLISKIFNDLVLVNNNYIPFDPLILQ
jgi:hypothetical protein